jgi:hypothetical protein
MKERENSAGRMIQEGKEGSRVFRIAGEAQKKERTSFSIDAESMRGPLGPELPSCSENSMIPGRWREESSSSPGRPGLLRRASKVRDGRFCRNRGSGAKVERDRARQSPPQSRGWAEIHGFGGQPGASSWIIPGEKWGMGSIFTAEKLFRER